MKKTIILILILTVFLFSETTDPLAGLGAPFIRMGMGTESQAMANASVAHLSPGVIPAYFNPAMSVLLREKKIIHTGIRMLSMGRRSGYISFITKIPPRMALNIALLYAGDNSIPIYDKDEAFDYEGGYFALGTFISLGYKIHRGLSIGLNTTIIHQNMKGDPEIEKLQMSSLEVGNLDFSLFYKISKKLSAGVNFKNLMSMISWEVPIQGEEVNLIHNDTLPLTINSGLSYKFQINKKNLLICYDLNAYYFSNKIDLKYSSENMTTAPKYLLGHRIGFKYEIYPVFPIYSGYSIYDGFSAGFGVMPVNSPKDFLRKSRFNYSVKIEPESNGFSHELGWTFLW